MPDACTHIHTHTHMYAYTHIYAHTNTQCTMQMVLCNANQLSLLIDTNSTTFDKFDTFSWKRNCTGCKWQKKTSPSVHKLLRRHPWCCCILSNNFSHRWEKKFKKITKKLQKVYKLIQMCFKKSNTMALLPLIITLAPRKSQLYTHTVIHNIDQKLLFIKFILKANQAALDCLRVFHSNFMLICDLFW